MTLSAITGALWAIAATIVAMLPMRLQYFPGITLLILAPILIGWIAIDFGLIVGALVLFGFLSMFRNPLIYFYRKFRGQNPDIPK